MADQSQPQAGGLVIPPEVQEKFGPILALIQGSESMNNEERQYWINILPIMTPEQLKNLEDILASEKKQLAAIDAKYSKEMQQAAGSATVASMEQKIRSQKQKRLESEAENMKREEEREQEILAQIQSF
jgi:hypothetical protein